MLHQNLSRHFSCNQVDIEIVVVSNQIFNFYQIKNLSWIRCEHITMIILNYCHNLAFWYVNQTGIDRSRWFTCQVCKLFAVKTQSIANLCKLPTSITNMLWWCFFFILIEIYILCQVLPLVIVYICHGNHILPRNF